MKYFITSLAMFVLFTVALVVSSCTPAIPSGGADSNAALTDAAIFDIAKQTQGYTWYKNSDVYIGRTPKSGHSEALMRTRYNVTAAALLDANGKVRSGTTFPEGSIITKELVNADRSLSGYAVMLKRKNDPSADADAWVWGYVTGSGAVRYAAANKGAGCIGCHSIAGHIDRTLMNVSVP